MVPHKPRLLLCTDLDRTLIPNGTAQEDARAREMFSKLCRHPGVSLVYVTGRDRRLVLDAVKTYNLPQPDYALTDVGSTIYRIVAGEWQSFQAWKHHLSARWPEAINQRVRFLVDRISGPWLQEEAKQNSFKVSFYLPLQLDVEQIMKNIEQRLQREGIAANLIWSIDEQKNIGLLDILPDCADKRQAIRFLQQQLGFADEELVFAGDSGNDLQVINSDIRSILVANAAPAIKEAALSWAQQNNQSATLYLAGGGLLALNGNYSAGILEGVCHFQPFFRSYLMKETA
ncbi:MAG: HAD-IIB family hydrolase [Pelovirga sp.]